MGHAAAATCIVSLLLRRGARRARLRVRYAWCTCACDALSWPQRDAATGIADLSLSCHGAAHVALACECGAHPLVQCDALFPNAPHGSPQTSRPSLPRLCLRFTPQTVCAAKMSDADVKKTEALTLRVVGEPAEVVKPAAVTEEASTAKAVAVPEDDGFALRGLPFMLVMFAMCLAVFIGGLDGTIVVVAMPQIAKDFDALSLISWIFLSFLLTQTAGTPLWGRASDMLGRKNAMLVAIGSFVVGSIACALSNTFASLVVFRAIQGIGGGGLMSVALILLADIVPASQRGAYLAPINSMFALSSVVGPILGGYITDGPGWRWCFWIVRNLERAGGAGKEMELHVAAFGTPYYRALRVGCNDQRSSWPRRAALISVVITAVHARCAPSHASHTAPYPTSFHRRTCRSEPSARRSSTSTCRRPSDART